MSFGGPHLLAPLPSMLGLRPGMRVSVQNPPVGFLEALSPLPEGCALVDSAPTGIDVTICFVQRKTELVEKLPRLAHHMAVTGRVWVCFPTAENAHVPTEDFVRLAALEVGLADDKKLMLDPAWTGLRLSWRPRGPRLEKPRAQA